MIEYVPVIESPCMSLCVMDEASGWCLGCGRTLDEIARWGQTDQADRDAVMAALPARMERLEGKAL
ncbi:DUF1289 domain-containing protein [Sphingomonas sp. KR3-1]|uniref:DUF1289 domain-containing protein n=1 Tax=Sphingomonas sp. KR3-1 TaxID=3156611 RepID=UPI0032B5EF7F